MKETNDTQRTIVEDEAIAEDIIRICEKACCVEESRYESLTLLSARLLTCVSILTAAIMAAVGISGGSPSYSLEPLAPIVLSSSGLALSFMLTLAAQWRFRYVAVKAPLHQVAADYSDQNITNCIDSMMYYVNALSVYHESLERRNRILQVLLDSSIACLVFAVMSAVIWIAMHFI